MNVYYGFIPNVDLYIKTRVTQTSDGTWKVEKFVYNLKPFWIASRTESSFPTWKEAMKYSYEQYLMSKFAGSEVCWSGPSPAYFFEEGRK